MPVAASKSSPRIETSPSLKNLKAGKIIQRSASTESLKILEQEKRAVKEARNKALQKTGLRLWYYRFQLISGSYMLETWESAIFNVFVLLSFYIVMWNAWKLARYVFSFIIDHSSL